MYDVKKHETYKDEKEEKTVRDFHKSRIAFLIINNNVEFLKSSGMSHIEWAKTLGINEQEFNNLVRGYVLNNNIVFYKGNFAFDDGVISVAKTYCKQIKNLCDIRSKCKVYCGVKIEGEKPYPPDYFLCEID